MILSKIIFNIAITSTNRTLQGPLLYSIAILSSPLVLMNIINEIDIQNIIPKIYM